MPTVTSDRDKLVKEIDGLVAADADAKTKAADLVAKTGAVAEAEANRVEADVASRVADELVSKQIAHLKAMLDGVEDDDPTPG